MKAKVIVALLAVLLAAGAAQADITINTVPVGNPANVGELSGAGGFGPERICGAVAYEYRIGKYEVTAGEYKDFLNAVAKTDTYGLYNGYMDSTAEGCQITQHGTSGNYTYDFGGRPSGTEDDWANRPVNYVSFWDACRFANWLHNGQTTGEQGSGTTETGAYALNGYNGTAGGNIYRSADAKWAVTSEDEWYKAAYYAPATASYFDYPTSSNSVPSNDLTSPDGGNNANFHESDRTIGSPYYRTEVGEFENSESPYGTFDQGGNVWEWNEAIIHQDSTRGQRGGSFDNLNYNMLASIRSNSGAPTGEDYTMGFRIVEVPEPATLSLLALGGLALLRTPRRPTASIL